MRSAKSKIISLPDLPALCERLRLEKKTIVTTNGCFDLLHWGHLKYLADARGLGDVLICGVNADASVRQLKGERRPINPERYRSLALASLEAVDYVSIFSEETPVEFLKRIRPAIHVKGGDYAGKEMPERQWVESYGGKIICLPLVAGLSTSQIIDSIKSA